MSTKLFPSQLEHETIYLVVREHWFHFFLKFLIWLFFAAALVLFNRYMPNILPGLFEGRASEVTELFKGVYTMFLMVSLFILWVLYYLNIQIITNLRIVDIDQVGIFSHTISELHIDNIEDVTSETNGIFGTIFDYGNVFVQTAASIERFEFSNVPNPNEIEKLILDLYEQNSNLAKVSSRPTRLSP